MLLRHFAAAAAFAAGTPFLHAQTPPFQTPGMPTYPAAIQETTGDMSQTSRFSSVFNPAFSFVIDAVGDYVDADSGADGWNVEMRTLEIGAQAWVDPNAWAYFIGATEGESVAIEEAAAHYVGFGPQTTVRAGRFFIDFGKQMQTHVHELRTIERPLVLRTYLGDEVKGDGLQFDQWHAIGDRTVLRWSVGGFANLLPEEEDEFDPSASAEPSVAERKSLGDFNYTARVTAFTEVGERGTFQLGTSARVLPDYMFEFEPSGAAAEELENTVLGLDATYGWTSDTGQRRWTLGGEFLVNTGDNGSEIDDAGTPADPTDDTILTLDDAVNGYYTFVDYALSPFDSVGVQYSALELPDASSSDQSEIEAYWSHSFSEFHRLRLAASSFDSDVSGEDSFRVALQYTLAIGAHQHGVNW